MVYGPRSPYSSRDCSLGWLVQMTGSVEFPVAMTYICIMVAIGGFLVAVNWGVSAI